MKYDKAKAYFAAAYLIEKSPVHWGMTDEDLARCIVPPIEEGTFVVGYHDDLRPYLFATYAFPEQEHLDEYYKTSTFPEEGFYGQGSIPFVIDFICMTGMRDIMSSFRYIKDMFKDMGYCEAHWLRTASDKRGWHTW